MKYKLKSICVGGCSLHICLNPQCVCVWVCVCVCVCVRGTASPSCVADSVSLLFPGPRSLNRPSYISFRCWDISAGHLFKVQQPALRIYSQLAKSSSLSMYICIPPLALVFLSH